MRLSSAQCLFSVSILAPERLPLPWAVVERPCPAVLCVSCCPDALHSRGVVQLFNAVQKHQRNVGEKVKEAGGSVRKRAKLMSTVSKKDFISVLRGMDGTSESSPAGKNPKARQVGSPWHGGELPLGVLSFHIVKVEVQGKMAVC